MWIDITPEDDVQEKIDSAQVGDIIRFHGTFHLDRPFIFWNNRAYDGLGSVFYCKTGAIEGKQRPDERGHANRLAQWLHNALYFPANAEPLSYDEIDENTSIYHNGKLIVDAGEILGPLPTTPWYFYPKRWLARQLLSIVHRVFWFPLGTLVQGFHLIGEPHEVSPVPSQNEQSTAISIKYE